jgi:hypothetical protein
MRLIALTALLITTTCHGGDAREAAELARGDGDWARTEALDAWWVIRTEYDPVMSLAEAHGGYGDEIARYRAATAGVDEQLLDLAERLRTRIDPAWASASTVGEYVACERMYSRTRDEYLDLLDRMAEAEFSAMEILESIP